jgi:hypothetical protein
MSAAGRGRLAVAGAVNKWRGVIGIRGDPERNQICRTAILSAVLGGRPLDPAEAARRTYASRQFEARMAAFGKIDESGWSRVRPRAESEELPFRAAQPGGMGVQGLRNA